MEVEPVKKLINSLLVFSALCAACPLWAGNAEGVFNDARSYTVQIRASVPVPFIDDEKGNFEGAGFVVDAKRARNNAARARIGQPPRVAERANGVTHGWNRLDMAPT